ncbi:hypothetical protein J6590_008042 [Homalodisca vitripennis]|nr:hypothetical protein J6590_008042 [Homalodisca vitripennis]
MPSSLLEDAPQTRFNHNDLVISPFYRNHRQPCRPSLRIHAIESYRRGGGLARPSARHCVRPPALPDILYNGPLSDECLYANQSVPGNIPRKVACPFVMCKCMTTPMNEALSESPGCIPNVAQHP